MVADRDDMVKLMSEDGLFRMDRSCDVGECIWSEQARFCDVLENACVPLDGKWPLVVLYLRGIRDVNFLSEVQKAEMQDILLRLLQEKKYSPEHFQYIQEQIFRIITAKYAEKIEAIARETSELAKDMCVMFGKRREDVAGVVERVDESLARGANPAELLAGLRDALKGVVAQMEQDACALAHLSQKDGLTGLANRRFFDSFLEESVERWKQTREKLSLLLFDIDHFKKFNDTYGHLVGDQVLRTLAQQIQKVVAPLGSDASSVLAARYGGEEFAVVLRGNVASRAAALAEVIRKTVQKTALLVRDGDDNVVQSGLRVTISIGVAQLWEGWTGAFQTNLVDFADKALYQAKRSGRNRTVQYLPESQEQFVPIPAE